LLALQRSAGNRAVSSILQRQKGTSADSSLAPAAPTPEELDSEIDDAIAGKDWAAVADALNGFSEEDIKHHLIDDKRLKGHRRQLMEGALRQFIHKPPPNRVADAIFDVDRSAARLGRIDYVHGAIARGDWEGAALAFNGFNNADIEGVLPRNEEQLKSLRAAAEKAMPGWSSRVTDPIDVLMRDPWALRPLHDRILHVMEALVDTNGYPVNGAAGLVGNMIAESGLIPSRVEGSSPSSPMRAKNFAGQVTDFTPDEVMNRDGKAGVGPQLPGAGLAQWTDPDRRRGLFANGSAILFDMEGQIAYLMTEMKGRFADVNKRLRKPTVTVQDAADDVLKHFENPEHPEQSIDARRANANQAAAVYRSAHPTPDAGTPDAGTPDSGTPGAGTSAAPGDDFTP
jgi:hypothetical protein